jgi:hypothetical protein
MRGSGVYRSSLLNGLGLLARDWFSGDFSGFSGFIVFEKIEHDTASE